MRLRPLLRSRQLGKEIYCYFWIRYSRDYGQFLLYVILDGMPFSTLLVLFLLNRQWHGPLVVGRRLESWWPVKWNWYRARTCHWQCYRAPRFSFLPCLDTVPDSGALDCEGRCPSSLPDSAYKDDILEIHKTGLFEAKWLWPNTQLQKSWLYPLIDVIFTRQEEFFQRIGRSYATDGQVANAGETPSSGKVQDSGPLFESASL